MIDLKKEIDKYKPILEIDGLQEDINKDDIKDIMDLLSTLKPSL